MPPIILERDRLFNRVSSSLFKERYVALICSPKTGLSQFIDELQRRIPYEYNDYSCIKIDAQDLGVPTRDNFCNSFGDILCKCGSIDDSKVSGQSITDCVKYTLSLYEPHTIVLIDNFQVLPLSSKKQFLSETRAVHTEGSMNSEYRKVLFVIGGQLDLWECEPVESSPWNIADRIYPNEFDLQTGELRLASSALLTAGFHIDSIAQQYLEEITRGHLYLFERLIAQIVKQNEGTSNREVLVDDINNAVNTLLSEPDEYFANLVDQVLQLDPDFQLFLAEVLNGIHHKFSRRDTNTRSLELVGIIIERNGYAHIRNSIIEKYLRLNLRDRLPLKIAPIDLIMPQLMGANLRAYETLFMLENELRNFLLSALYSKYKGKWENHLPRSKNWVEARARQKTEKEDRYRAQPQCPILCYCEFPDLKELIDNEWGIFERFFGPKGKFEATYSRLEIFRNTIAHNRSLSHRNYQELENINKTLLSCMGHIEP